MFEKFKAKRALRRFIKNPHNRQKHDSLITAFAKLELHARAEILSVTSYFNDDKLYYSKGNNVLQYCAYKHPGAVAGLLEVIATLDQRAQENILTYHSQARRQEYFNSNALQIALRCKNEAISPLLKTTIKMKQEIRYEILSNLNIYFKLGKFDPKNCLAIALTTDNFTDIAPILRVFFTLSAQQQINVSSIALHSCIIHKLQTFQSFLEIIESLGQHHTYCALVSMVIGWNALQRAIIENPIFVQPLLKTIVNLSQEQQFKILSNRDKDGRNALQLAIVNDPISVQPLLKAIVNLGQSELIDILGNRDKDGRNALQLAIIHDPKSVQPLLKTIANLNQDTQLDLLDNQDKNGFDALQLALRHHLGVAEQIRNAIPNLNGIRRIEKVSQANEAEPIPDTQHRKGSSGFFVNVEAKSSNDDHLEEKSGQDHTKLT